MAASANVIRYASSVALFNRCPARRKIWSVARSATLWRMLRSA